MNWSILLYLLCPVMMIFCMGSMFKPKKKQGTANPQDTVANSADELRQLQTKMADLMIENHRLKGELGRDDATADPSGAVKPVAEGSTGLRAVR